MTEREIGAIMEGISIITDRISSMEAKLDKLDDRFVTVQRFLPIERVYHALVNTLIMASAIGLIYFAAKAEILKALQW